jgi:hypothetical protein
MAETQPSSGQRRERPSTALTLCGVVLGAAMFGFTAAGLWYQFCLDQGAPDAASAFANLAPPPALILLASLGLFTTVSVQLQTLGERSHVDEDSEQSRALPESEPDVRSPVAPFVDVSEETERSAPRRSQSATS